MSKGVASWRQCRSCHWSILAGSGSESITSHLLDVDAISHVVWVLDEEEDATEQDLLHRRTDQPGQAQNEGAGRRDECGKLGRLWT